MIFTMDKRRVFILSLHLRTKCQYCVPLTCEELGGEGSEWWVVNEQGIRYNRRGDFLLTKRINLLNLNHLLIWVERLVDLLVRCNGINYNQNKQTKKTNSQIIPQQQQQKQSKTKQKKIPPTGRVLLSLAAPIPRHTHRQTLNQTKWDDPITLK